jgi:helicase SWR1
MTIPKSAPEVEADVQHAEVELEENGDGNASPTRSNDGDITLAIKDESETRDATPQPNADTSIDLPETLPTAKQHESEATLSTPEPTADKSVKKRKRPASPPWQFPTAETTTLKSADGRRVSARVNLNGTPGLSESEGRGRSGSQTTAPRSRPASPPWKKFGADGPTTLNVDGKRKSGRFNKDVGDTPKRVSPRSKKQVDKLGASKQEVKTSGKKAVALPSRKQEAEDKLANVEDRMASFTTNTKIKELQAQIAALQPTRSFPAPEPVRNKPGPKPGSKRKATQDAKAEDAPAATPQVRKAPRRGNVSPSPEDRTKPSPKIKLRINAPRKLIDPPNPRAIPREAAHPPQISLHQLLEQWELKEAQQPYMENDRGPPDAEYFAQRAIKQAAEEAAMRERILKEAQPGGILSRDHLSLYQKERQLEPLPQYGHHDDLVAHALFLRQLQKREKVHHRTLAKKIAFEALDKWKAIHGPTEEDLVVEQDKIFRLVAKQVFADMKAKWELVEAHVREGRRKVYEAEQEALRAEKLQKQLERSELLLAKQRGDADSDVDMDEDSTGDVELGSDEEDVDGDDEEENMSDSASEAAQDAEEEEGEMDDDTLAAYLAQRQAEPPDKQIERMASEDEGEDEDADTEMREAHSQDGDDKPSVHTDKAHGDGDGQEDAIPERRVRKRGAVSRSPSPTREELQVEEHLSSDESTDMDSEDYDSDEDMSSTGDEANDDDDNEGDAGSDVADKEPAVMRNSLLALYSAKELLREKDGGLPTPMTSVENGGDNDNPQSGSESRFDEQANAGAGMDQDSVDAQLDVNGTDEHEEPQAATPAANDTPRSTPLAEEDSQEVPEDDVEEMDIAEDSTSKALVPVPSMLRGTLRSYQHAGLDWLASLYRNGTNGILADEMGLGKTIQTISLLGHLAEVHEVWETHLVIVPTSVILNWVTEFHKFLPGFRVLAYYGTLEERVAKRKGWSNDPHHENREKRGYNVVITSYNVAMQDINAIRNVQWHYLILDEAHNIRNFNSQRWQTLIRLRTKARLLLTGTPLQNDLAEVWALLTFLTAGDDDRSHGELEEFLSHWKDPVKEIFDQGVQKISENAQRVVSQLHISLRPFLLRRKKIEVEKDLPKKTESVVVCKLSKRQRQLYQDYMGLAETKASLAKGNGVQAGAVLLSLRRVCNHPDLFDPRPIQTSFAMDTSPLEIYTSKERLVRQLLGVRDDMPDAMLVTGNEHRSKSHIIKARTLSARAQLQREVSKLEAVPAGDNLDPSTISGGRALRRLHDRQRKVQQMRTSIQATDSAFARTPIYGSDLREVVTTHTGKPYHFKSRRQPLVRVLQGWASPGRRPLVLDHPSDWSAVSETRLQTDIATYDKYAERLKDIIVRFTFVPPAATVPILDYAIPPRMQETLRALPSYPAEEDWGHEARVRASIAFPDSRLLIYDSGKLQRLTYLLRELQSKGSRSLIFTQMTGTLNILEQFLSLMNLPYLRLDGSTPVERRQIMSAEFNRPDSKYQCMILSSRAGGVGLNLTGASSVIFYDLDWNPQMDRQCMDRAHRIGQVRDVEVYKMVSEKTVEENILRRANQKSLLDQTVIQDGHFTTEYQQPTRQATPDTDSDEVAVAIERFLGGEEKTTTQALESVEDREDVLAAQQARKEDLQDDVDFAERSSKGPSKANTPGPSGTAAEEVVDELKGHVDRYMIGAMEWMLKDWVYAPPPVRRLGKDGRDPSHRPKKKR